MFTVGAEIRSRVARDADNLAFYVLSGFGGLSANANQSCVEFLIVSCALVSQSTVSD